MSDITFGPELARSWLLVNAATPDRFAPAINSQADVVVIDIEDAVAPANKDSARDKALEFFGSGNPGWVRMNGWGTPYWADDCAALNALPNLGGVVLAMVENPDAILATAEQLPGTLIIALVETALGVQNLGAIASSGKTFRLASGRATSVATPASPMIRCRWPTPEASSPSPPARPVCPARSMVPPSVPWEPSWPMPQRWPPTSG